MLTSIGSGITLNYKQNSDAVAIHTCGFHLRTELADSNDMFSASNIDKRAAHPGDHIAGKSHVQQVVCVCRRKLLLPQHKDEPRKLSKPESVIRQLDQSLKTH